ncbi:hypothetical protein ACVW0Y_003587 [Pseudomonas sp. TE3786]
MNQRHTNRFFNTVLCTGLFVLMVLVCGLMALLQTNALRDSNINFQVQTVPFSRGLVELESNLSALAGSDAILRSQADNRDLDTAELIRAHNYMARVFTEATALSTMDLGPSQRATLVVLQDNVSRLMRLQDEFGNLVSAAQYAQAVDHYDKQLLAQSTDLAAQVNDFIGLARRWQQDDIDTLISVYTASYWWIVLCLGLVIVATLLATGWHLQQLGRAVTGPA